MIETTLGALVGAEPALRRLLALPLPIKAAYSLAKLGRLVEAELAVYRERRVALLKQLGEERPPTDAERQQGATAMVQVKPEHLAAFQGQMAELDAVVVSLPWSPFPLDQAKDVTISASDLIALDALVAGPPLGDGTP